MKQSHVIMIDARAFTGVLTQIPLMKMTMKISLLPSCTYAIFSIVSRLLVQQGEGGRKSVTYGPQVNYKQV